MVNKRNELSLIRHGVERATHFKAIFLRNVRLCLHRSFPVSIPQLLVSVVTLPRFDLSSTLCLHFSFPLSFIRACQSSYRHFVASHLGRGFSLAPRRTPYIFCHCPPQLRFLSPSSQRARLRRVNPPSSIAFARSRERNECGLAVRVSTYCAHLSRFPPLCSTSARYLRLCV